MGAIKGFGVRRTSQGVSGRNRRTGEARAEVGEKLPWPETFELLRFAKPINVAGIAEAAIVNNLELTIIPTVSRRGDEINPEAIDTFRGVHERFDSHLGRLQRDEYYKAWSQDVVGAAAEKGLWLAHLVVPKGDRDPSESIAFDILDRSAKEIGSLVVPGVLDSRGQFTTGLTLQMQTRDPQIFY